MFTRARQDNFFHYPNFFTWNIPFKWVNFCCMNLRQKVQNLDMYVYQTEFSPHIYLYLKTARCLYILGAINLLLSQKLFFLTNFFVQSKYFSMKRIFSVTEVCVSDTNSKESCFCEGNWFLWHKLVLCEWN